jgi:hypothetical protein
MRGLYENTLITGTKDHVIPAALLSRDDGCGARHGHPQVKAHEDKHSSFVVIRDHGLLYEDVEKASFILRCDPWIMCFG